MRAACAAVFGLVVIGAMALTADHSPALPPVNPKADAAKAKADVAIDSAVALLVKDLGSPDYRTREKAGKALEAKGDQILPQLRQALSGTDDPEVARRLTVLVRRMDHDRLVSPRRVTFTMKDRPIKDAVDEINKQTGYNVILGGGPGGPGGPKYSFAFDNTPFWEAVDKVATAGRLYIQTGYDDDTVQLYYNGSEQVNPFVAYPGPFRILPQNINANRSLQLSGVGPGGAGGRGVESLGIGFLIFSEPKNPMLGVTNYQADVIAATDEFGGSLIPPKDPNSPFSRSHYYPGNYRNHQTNANLNLIRANKDATTIKVLKGKLGIILLAGTVPEIVVPDPMKVKNKKFVGRTVEIELDSVTEANGNYSVTMTVVKLDAKENDPDGYAWTNNIWQKIELFDEKGNRYRGYGYNSLNNNGNHTVQMTAQFGPENRRGGGPPAKMGPPVKLVFNEWLSVTHEVTFEFKNVPLP